MCLAEVNDLHPARKGIGSLLRPWQNFRPSLTQRVQCALVRTSLLLKQKSFMIAGCFYLSI